MDQIYAADFIELFTKIPLSEAEVAALRSLTSPHPQEDEEKILAYLGAPLSFSATQLFVDHFDNERAVTSFATKSDGVWAWSNALEYYVKRYHFRVPREFVDHMRIRNWVPPQRDTLDWDDIAKRYYQTDEAEN